MKQNKRNSVYLLVRRVCRIVQHTVTLVTQLCLRLFRLHSHRRHIPLVRGVLGGVFVVVLATLLCTLLHPQATSAATGTEQEMSFEGKIVTSAGLNIPDGNYNMEFKIYTGCTNEPTSNTGCTAVWTEDYLTSNATYATTSPVTFTSGSYAVNLGSICSFSGGSCEGNTNTAINWDSYPLYLSLNIGTTAVCSAGFASCGAGDGAMNPYVLLTSAPYAMNAANSNEVGGDTLSQLGVLAANNTWTGNNIMQASTNSVGALQVENAAGNAALTVDTTDSTVNVIGESAAPTYVNDWEAHATNQATVSVSPATLGDLMVLAANIGTTGVTVTSVSGGGVSNWHQVKTNTGLAHQEIWEGTVTSTGSSTITLTYSSTPGVSCDLDAEEFTAGLGANTNWFITTATNFNNVSSATITYPSLTPTQPNGLYWAYARSASSGVAGSTSGFSYKVTGASNVVTYDPSLTAGTAYSPTATNSPAAVSEGVAMIISSSLGGLNVDNTLQVGGASTFDSNVSVRAGNSTTAFQVQNTTGSTVFNVDTTDQQISADQNTSSTVLPTMSLIQNGSSSSTLALQNNATSSAFYLSNNASNSNALTINSYTAATTISATPTAVQYTSVAATASATTQTLAFSSNNTAGNTIVVAVSWNTTSGLTPVCSDSQGNTYSAVFTETDAANNSQSGICYASNIKAGANTVTVTYPTSVAYRSLAIQEFSGITTTGPVVDTDAINTATGTSGTNGYTSNAATTTTSGDLVFGFFVDETGSTATATASTSPNLFAQLTDNTTLGSPVTTEDTVQTSAGSIAAIQNENQAHAYTGMMMAFKPSTVTGGSFTNTNTNGLLSMSQSGQATFKNSTNSTTAFQIQNSSSNTIFNVNTTAGGVTITNPVSTASPAITTQSSGWEWDNYNNTGGLTQLVVAPHAVGDIMLVGVYNEGEQITGISGGGVSNWQLVMNGGGTGPVYEGTVTSPGASIISIASTGSVTLAFGEIMAQEFSSAYGASTVWSVVATGSVSNASLGTATFPSLTTTAANQLYWGYAGVSSSFTTGNTCTPAGFTCKATAAGDFMAWDANTAANTQYTPVGTLNSSGTSSIQAMIITASPGSGIALNVNGSSQVTAASTTAFQVQNTTGTSVMNVDTQNNAIVLGADGSPQANVTVRGGMASGANTSGGNITFEASNGTGTGGSGSFVFQTAAPASSTTVQTDNSADAGTLNGTSSNPLTLSYTTGTEPNRLMVVQINSGCGNSVVSMTYNGITLSQLASDNTPSVDNTTCNAHTEVWDLVAPPSGTYNLVVTYAGNEGTAGVSTFYNVNQTAPIGPIATASGSTSGTQTTSLNVTATSSSQLVYDAIATDEGCQMVGGPSSGQTQLWEYNTCTGLYAGGSSSKPGTSGTVNMGWQTTTSDWTDVGFAINPITSTTADGLSNSLVIANNGAATFESATDSTGALDVLSAAGSFSVFDVDTTDDNVYIGTATDTNTTPALLVLNNYDTFTDPTTPTTCSSSSDLGALYYNDATNNVRACLAGSWQDLVSTASLAQLLFGVVPNSGSHSGDLIGASATATNASNTGGPCKVNYDGTGSVYVNSCLAYSGGREVSVAAQAVSLSGVAATSYDNLCLNSSGVPALVGGTSGTNGSETVNNLSTTNAITMGQPLLCLATILTGSASTLSKIYDVRTFTTTTKTYATITTAADAYLGAVVAPSGTSGEVVWAATLGGLVQGVIVASTGTAGSLGAPNVMIATAGPQWVFGSAGTLNNYVEATASGGVANTTATVADSYNILGVDLNTYGTSCAAQTYGATDCQYSLFTYLDIQ